MIFPPSLVKNPCLSAIVQRRQQAPTIQEPGKEIKHRKSQRHGKLRSLVILRRNIIAKRKQNNTKNQNPLLTLSALQGGGREKVKNLANREKRGVCSFWFLCPFSLFHPFIPPLALKFLHLFPLLLTVFANNLWENMFF